jgi:hypothetical protein
MPKNVKRVAVPAFQTEARGLRYRVGSRFTEAVGREIIRRGNGLKVQGSTEGADAVVEGTIRDFSFTGVLLDRDGRARVYEVTIVSAVTVRDLKENKILYDNQNFIFRDSFEFSQDPRSFFQRGGPGGRAYRTRVLGVGRLRDRERTRCERGKIVAILTREDLRSQLRRHEIKPVYVLFGSETYLRDVALKFICDRSFAAGELRDFNENEFSLNTEGKPCVGARCRRAASDDGVPSRDPHRRCACFGDRDPRYASRRRRGVAHELSGTPVRIDGPYLYRR